jgi:hypothetical protein
MAGTALGVAYNFPIPVPDVAGWLEYGRCSFQKFISFCPVHVQGLLSVLKKLETKEPFGTLKEIQDAIVGVQAIIQSHSTIGGEAGANPLNTGVGSIWGPATGGEGVTVDQMQQIIPLIPSTSIWNGGPLDLTVGGDGGLDVTDRAYLIYCTDAYARYVGNASYGMCYALITFSKLTDFLAKGQLIIDTLAIIMVIGYIINRWGGSGVPA